MEGAGKAWLVPTRKDTKLHMKKEWTRQKKIGSEKAGVQRGGKGAGARTGSEMHLASRLALSEAPVKGGCYYESAEFRSQQESFVKEPHNAHTL